MGVEGRKEKREEGRRRARPGEQEEGRASDKAAEQEQEACRLGVPSRSMIESHPPWGLVSLRDNAWE